MNRHITTETTVNGVTSKIRPLKRHLPWARWSNWCITEGSPLRIETETTCHAFKWYAQLISDLSSSGLSYKQSIETRKR
jgi:hypothetical protein